MKRIEKYIVSVVSLLVSLSFQACDKEDHVRQPADILGIWQETGTHFIEMKEDNVARELDIVYQDGESIGEWSAVNVYYYEPGYNLVIYLTDEHEANVYQITELTSQRMVWCWVDEIKAEDTESIGSIIGDIINKAQDGYKLNPELYQSFTRISEDQFLSILDGLDIIY